MQERGAQDNNLTSINFMGQLIDSPLRNFPR